MLAQLAHVYYFAKIDYKKYNQSAHGGLTKCKQLYLTFEPILFINCFFHLFEKTEYIIPYSILHY